MNVEEIIAQLRIWADQETTYTRGWALLHEAADFIAKTQLPETDDNDEGLT